ncbi:MAG: UbiA family prenyltransferase [Phycisphaerae bacterium]|nr:UbiA family prenyltransferase [Phycisphaerae bacterium]
MPVTAVNPAPRAGGSTPRRGGDGGPSSAGLGARLAVVAGEIKLAHSIFALPFAVLGAFLAWDGARPWRSFAAQMALIVACMFFARTWAMLVNRWADAGFDARNPRTARRAIPAGRLGSSEVAGLALACAVAFVALCGAFLAWFANPWPLALSIPVLAWIAFYSFTKRFTWAAHLFVGSALALSPLAAALAVDPLTLGRVGALPLIASMVLLWVAGFDVIYALQDVEFDRAEGLHSIPSRLGIGPAMWMARGLHLLAFASLAAAWGLDARFGWLFGAAVMLVGALLIAEHVVLARRGKDGLDLAFFTLNGVVSVVVGVLGVADLIS